MKVPGIEPATPRSVVRHAVIIPILLLTYSDSVKDGFKNIKHTKWFRFLGGVVTVWTSGLEGVTKFQIIVQTVRYYASVCFQQIQGILYAEIPVRLTGNSCLGLAYRIHWRWCTQTAGKRRDHLSDDFIIMQGQQAWKFLTIILNCHK